MRVLMTGGYGCIGSWVAKGLVEAGREVWVYDLKEDHRRLALLLPPEALRKVHFIPGDVAEPDAVRAAVERMERGGSNAGSRARRRSEAYSMISAGVR